MIVDKLSKYARLVPTTTTVTAPGVAKLFVDHIYRFFGMPTRIISDRDTKFTSLFWQSLFRTLGTHLAMSTAHHQQTNGQTERLNSVVESTLRAFVNHRQDDWDEHLALVEFAINNTKQASTGHTPFFLNFGYHPTTPTAMLNGPSFSPVQSVENMLTGLKSLNKWTRDNLLRAQQRQTAGADKHRRDVTFSVGDEVLVDSLLLKTDAQMNRPAEKLSHKWVGPFRVTAVDHSTVTVTLPSTSRAWNVLHVSEVKLYRPSPEHTADRPSPDFVDQDGVEHYVVEKVLNKKIKKTGRRSTTYYLIKWEGFPEHDATWEPEYNLEGAKDLVQEYELSS